MTLPNEHDGLHHRELAYTVHIDKPNPVFARMLKQAIGGPEGEMRVMTQYMFQGFGCPSLNGKGSSRCSSRPALGQDPELQPARRRSMAGRDSTAPNGVASAFGRFTRGVVEKIKPGA